VRDVPSRVIEIDAAATHDLRRRVLRVGTTSTAVVFPGDDAPDTFHLGVELDGQIVAVSTWMLRLHPADTMRPGCQLRGMATHPAVRGHGYGALLLDVGLQRAMDAGIEIVWANARIDALGFYLAHGFDPGGPQFLDAVTGLLHQRIVRIASVAAPTTPTVG
jgi:GNAT superfamily N-acetyltransferase